jgi:single-stranded-DNA-specific exonuclease
MFISSIFCSNSAFSLLTTTDPAEAQRLALELNERNILRQKITTEIMAQVEEQIDAANLPLVIVAVAGPKQIWNEGVIGLVAGRIMDKYYRPTLIITHSQKESGEIVFKSSGRSVPEFNLIAAIEACSQYLDKYGGHPMACGFSLLGEKNLLAFKKGLERLASKELKEEDLIPKLKIDAVLNFSEINLDLVKKINNLAPYGKNNPQPCLVSYGASINDIITMGVDGQHIKFRLSAPGSEGGRLISFWALAFGASKKYQNFKISDKIDIVYYLEINDFRGRRDVQLKIVDIKTSE